MSKKVILSFSDFKRYIGSSSADLINFLTKQKIGKIEFTSKPWNSPVTTGNSITKWIIDLQKGLFVKFVNGKEEYSKNYSIGELISDIMDLSSVNKANDYSSIAVFRRTDNLKNSGNTNMKESYNNKEKIWSSGSWEIYKYKNRANKLALSVENSKTGFIDYPILYDDGRIGYDYPERIPSNIKSKLEKLYPSVRVESTLITLENMIRREYKYINENNINLNFVLTSDKMKNNLRFVSGRSNNIYFYGYLTPSKKMGKSGYFNKIIVKDGTNILLKYEDGKFKTLSTELKYANDILSAIYVAISKKYTQTTTTESKIKTLENLIKKVINEMQPGQERFYISYYATVGEHGEAGTYSNFKSAVTAANSKLKDEDFMDGLIYVGVEPTYGGSEFAVMYATPDYLQRLNKKDFNSPEDYKTFINVYKKSLATKKPQMGKFE